MLSWPCLEPDDSCSTLIHVKGQGLGSGTSAITPILGITTHFSAPRFASRSCSFHFTILRSMSRNSRYEFTHTFTSSAHAQLICVPISYQPLHIRHTHSTITNTSFMWYWQDPNTCPTIFSTCLILYFYPILTHIVPLTYTTIYCTQITVYPIVLIFTYKPNNQSTNCIHLFSHIPFNPLHSLVILFPILLLNFQTINLFGT